MKSAIATLLFGLLALTSARKFGRTPPRHSEWVSHGWTPASSDYVQSHLSEAEFKVMYFLSLAPNGVDWLEEFTRDVSSIRSPHYGQYATQDEVIAKTAPGEKSLQTIRDEARRCGVSPQDVHVHRMQDTVSLRPRTLEQASCLAGASVRAYTGPTGAIVFTTSAPLEISREVSSVTDFISGFSTRPIETRPHAGLVEESLLANYSTTSILDGANYLINGPADIYELYNVEWDGSDVDPTYVQAVTGFLGQYFSQTDLNTWQKLNDITPYNIAKVIGFNNYSYPGGEAQLDVTASTGVALNVPTWFWSTNGVANATQQEPWAEWLTDFFDADERPNLISSSYGEPEEMDVPESYAYRVDLLFSQGCAMGYTFLVSSGDNGAGCNEAGDRLQANFPAASPHVLSVGATTANLVNFEPVESGAIWPGFGGSSGGFSDFYPRPWYQEEAVEAYVSDPDNLPPQSFFNITGRAVPDVSTVGTGFAVVLDGKTYYFVGTSCASPTMAGILSVINQNRLAAGMPLLGWVNDLIYNAYTAGAFNDIIGDETNEYVYGNSTCGVGFQTVEGYDAFTGLGTPRFDVLNSFALDSEAIPALRK